MLLITLIMLFVLFGCLKTNSNKSNNDSSYTSISMDSAVEMINKDDDHILLDVRTTKEYDESHIPGAINIPVENIDDNISNILSDNKQVILIYCRSGNRSKQAAEKLSNMGYENIYEIGGIIDWKGDIVTEDLYQHKHDEMDCSLIIEVEDRQMFAYFENNTSAKALIEKLSKKKEIEIHLADYGGFEKVGTLPWSLPKNDENITTTPGDIILYQGDKFSIYYDENTWSFTKLAHLNGMTKEEILDIVGKDDVIVKLSLDWWND